MSPEIDLTRGGYGGDVIEETFKPFTAQYMEYWWHFREVLRSTDRKEGHEHWSRIDGNPLSDDEWEELIALSLTHYAVYTNIAESLSFYEQMTADLSRSMLHGQRIFEVRRSWKSMYSSLYTALNALSNIVCAVVGRKPLFEIKKSGEVRNHTPGKAHGLMQSEGINDIAVPLDRCIGRMEIRNHLDHYWTIWQYISQGSFFIDGDFKKGYVRLEPKIDCNAADRARDDLIGCVQDFNLIYKKMATKEGFLDSYLQDKGWEVDYSDLGPPHNGQRPNP